MKQPLSQIDATELNLNDKLIDVNRVAKVMKGGKRLRFSALVVTGDGEGMSVWASARLTRYPPPSTRAALKPEKT